ncbi:unnamed protein product [marine sediment metagenome]|uniref:Uncharacterized protein n=1 Tax=marine sediment metagenome TaxID=412755 RepID=X1K6E7_9ZZZZ
MAGSSKVSQGTKWRVKIADTEGERTPPTVPLKANQMVWQ